MNKARAVSSASAAPWWVLLPDPRPSHFHLVEVFGREEVLSLRSRSDPRLTSNSRPISRRYSAPNTQAGL
jgi:hypothetical protein